MFVDQEIYPLKKIRSDVLEYAANKEKCNDWQIIKLYCIINNKYGYLNEDGEAVIQER